MSLKATNLVVQMAPLDVTFKGSPQDLAAEMIRRLRILSPTGTNFIFIGDVEPTSNVGPWLKGGTQWWVWDPGTKRYIPLDISASFTIPFFVGNTTPATSIPPVWLQTTQDATDTNPNDFGEPIGWNIFNGTAWVPFNSIMLSGPTASRPSNPADYQEYYDTDISCRIWWERGAWRTVDGNINDVKAVYFSNLDHALTANPGWAVLGAANQHIRGRIIMQAAANGDGSEALTTDAGVPERFALTAFGETDQVQLNPASTVPYPPQLALWHLIKL